MKRLVVVATLFVSVLLAPHAVYAKAIEDLQIAADPADLVVTVLSDVPLRTPTIRTYAGLVRVRFYDVLQPASMRVDGDGGALRAAELGRGSDQTAALTLVLGDQTKIEPADVRVEIAGSTITMRLARGLLPAIREGALAARPARLAPTPALPIAAATPAKEPPVTTAVSAPTPSKAIPEVARTTAQPTATPTQAAPQPAAEPAPIPQKPMFGKPKPAAKKDTDSKLTGGTISTLPLLLGYTALLGLAYLGLQLFLRKKGTIAGTASIDIIAHKRLGPRHQLVIVRAFDRDYLLSIQGGQTTVVARSSRKKVDTADAVAAASSRPVRHIERDFEEDDEVTFGGELFKQALAQRERAREKSAAYRIDQALRETREEKPRNELDRIQVDSGYSEDGRIVGNDGRVGRVGHVGRVGRIPVPEPRAATLEERLAAAEASEARGDTDDEMSPVVPEGMSESVTGLLRLRKQAGR
jgi:flagellar biogenesis protein FliO